MKILFPTDFSPAAQNAYEYAIGLAKDLEAVIEFIHVYPSSLKPREIYLSQEDARDERLKEQTEMQQKLDDFVSQFNYDKIGDKLVYPGVFTDQEIVDRTSKSVDLVVMGTKGERNPVNKLMGSVTTRLMMNSECPVLAVPKNARYNGINQITYATSFDANDEHFFGQLENFSNSIKSKINFLHVTSDPNVIEDKEMQSRYLPSQVSKFFIIKNPSPIEGVDEFVKENTTDLIAMYIPKRKLWEQLFHTSFSKKMTFQTDIPLFVYKC